MNDPLSNPSDPARRGSSGRKWLVGAALATAFVAGGLTIPALAASAQEAAMGMGHGGAWMGHGGMHAMGKAHLERVLTAVDATPEQRAKIETILHAAFASMGDMHGKMGEAHGALIAALTGPTVDRDALERLRAEHMAKFDQASRTIVAALADAAEVLRPDQRAKLATVIAAHRQGG